MSTPDELDDMPPQVPEQVKGGGVPTPEVAARRAIAETEETVDDRVERTQDKLGLYPQP